MPRGWKRSARMTDGSVSEAERETMREISPEELNERMRGFATHTGVVIEAATPGSGTVSLELSEKTRNPNGTVHGGVYFTLMDVAAGVSGVFKEEGNRKIVSQCASVYFLRPAVSGKITAKAVLVRDGRRTALSRVDVFDEKEQLLATGEFELFYVDEMP